MPLFVLSAALPILLPGAAAGQQLQIEPYRLEVVAHSSEYPPDPLSSNRQFGPTGPQLNQAGQVLFTAHWRDGSTARNDSSVNIGRPGQVTRVVSGADPVPDYPNVVFNGRLDQSGGNFVHYTFNSTGELLFTGGVRHERLVTPPPIPFDVGLFQGTAGGFALLTGTTRPNLPNPPLANVANAPYAGTGTLVFGLGPDPRGFGSISMADNGKVYFSAFLDALEPDAFGNIVARPIVSGGLFEEQPVRRLIIYPGGPAPGLPGDQEIVAYSQVGSWGSSMGQRNGVFLIQAIVRPRGSTAQGSGVFYEYRDGNLRVVYVQGDPLPDLPPLSDVLGTAEPHDIEMSLQAVDEMGLGVFFAYARPRTSGESRALGYWKTTTNGLALVLRFGIEYPTLRGPVVFPTPPIATQQRLAMGGGRVAFLTGFTGLGATVTTPGVFREVDGGFEMVAAAGLTVPGTRSTLANNFINDPLWMNASNEVAFYVSYRTNATGPLTRALWVAGRDSRLRQIYYPGQPLPGFGTNPPPRTITAAGLGTRQYTVFNDDGMLVLTALLNDNSYAILRAVPPPFEDPPCFHTPLAAFRPALAGASPAEGGAVCGEHFFWAPTTNNNWHGVAIGPRTNWEDSKQIPRDQPPGVAEPGTATVFINAVPGETIVLNRQPTSIGSVSAVNGLLRLQRPLTLNQPSTLHDLRMESPAGSLTINADTSITNTFEWISGTVNGNVSGPGRLSASSVLLTNGTTTRLNTALIVNSNLVFDGGGTLILSNAVLRTGGNFVARIGTITNSSGASPVQNNGLLRKQGAGDFTIHPPYHGFEALLRQPPWGIKVEEGRLRLLDGGLFLGYHTNEIDLGTELEMAGPFTFQGEYTAFRGDGTVRLGKPDDGVELRVSLSTKVEFGLGGNSAHFNNGVITGSGTVTNSGAFFWEGGVIGRADGIFPVGFQNGGELFIEDAPAPLRLEGGLLNTGQVFQRGTIESSTVIRNEGGRLQLSDTDSTYRLEFVSPAEWRITRSADIVPASTAAEFINMGDFVVEPESPGVANIDVTFESRPIGFPFFRPSVICGKENESNPAFTLRFRGDVRNYSASLGGTLSGGIWIVGPECTMDFVGKDIRTIEKSTAVFLNAGDMPALKLVENYGFIEFKDKNYSTPGGLFNPGTLAVSGSSVLTVNGRLDSHGELVCNSPALVDVRGDAFLDGQISVSAGQILVSGALTVNGIVQAHGVLQAPSIVFADESNIKPGGSPGILRLVGSLVQSNGSVLEMELAGTASNRFDVLSVSGSASLAGTLGVNLIEDFRPEPDDSFPIVQAGSIAGQFGNAPNGQRLATFDGYGSFLVTYSPTNVVLSAFQANPNPPPTAPGRLLTPTFAFGNLELALTGSPGRDYILQTSTNLLDWLSLLTNNASFDGQLRFQLPTTIEPYRFFRALAP